MVRLFRNSTPKGMAVAKRHRSIDGTSQLLFLCAVTVAMAKVWRAVVAVWSGFAEAAAGAFSTPEQRELALLRSSGGFYAIATARYDCPYMFDHRTGWWHEFDEQK